MQELWELLGGEVTAGLSFGRENGETRTGAVLHADRAARCERHGRLPRSELAGRLRRRDDDPLASRRPRSRADRAVRDALDPLRLRGRQVMIRPAELIERKRNGEELSAEEISELILGYARGEIPDYQLAAFCMAVYFQGMTAAETYALTDAMIRSGRTLDLGTALGRKVVDKHSTGGVGDKTTIAVGPIVAACGVPVGKMSGRGLGHTGGTLDKLESIPGFDVELSVDQFITQVKTVGLAIIGQTDDLVPGGQAALRAPRRDRDRGHPAADRVLDHVEEDRRRRRRDRARREGRRRRVHEDARRRPRPRRDDARARPARRPRGRLPAHRHGSTARSSRRQLAGDRRGARHGARRRAAGLHGARARRVRPAAVALRPRRQRRGRAAAPPRPRSRTARRWRSTSAGSARRAAIPTRPRCRRRRSSCR